MNMRDSELAEIVLRESERGRFYGLTPEDVASEVFAFLLPNLANSTFPCRQEIRRECANAINRLIRAKKKRLRVLDLEMDGEVQDEREVPPQAQIEWLEMYQLVMDNLDDIQAIVLCAIFEGQKPAEVINSLARKFGKSKNAARSLYRRTILKLREHFLKI